MRAASPLVLVSAVLAEPAPESKLPATKHKSKPTRLSVSCEISLKILHCTRQPLLLAYPRSIDIVTFQGRSKSLLWRGTWLSSCRPVPFLVPLLAPTSCPEPSLRLQPQHFPQPLQSSLWTFRLPQSSFASLGSPLILISHCGLYRCHLRPHASVSRPLLLRCQSGA